MTRIALNGSTAGYAVLGHPVAHSLSPQMQNAALGAAGIDAVYLPFDVDVADLPVVLDGMRRMGFRGLNLTIPLKEAAVRRVESLDASAQRLGAVNTIAFRDGVAHGYNTDGVGFLRDLNERMQCSPQGRRVMILGCGGAGRAMAITCAIEGAVALVLANRTPERARRLAHEIGNLAPDCPCRIAAPEAWEPEAQSCDLIVQCTASGLRADDPPLLAAGAFRPGQKLYDLIYVQPQTPIMRTAVAQGAETVNGLGMLLHQGAESFRIWTGIEPDLGCMRRTLETALSDLGAPGCRAPIGKPGARDS